MKVEKTRRVVIEMSKNEVENILKNGILEKTGIWIGESELHWTRPQVMQACPDFSFVRVNIEEPYGE